MLNRKFIKEVGLFPWVTRTAIRQFYKRVLKREQRMKLPTGSWMALPMNSSFASEAYVTAANVDWGSEALLRALISGKGAFLDVGANIGYYSLYFAPHASAVYSFEPDPRARLGLEKNLSGNANAHVVPCALGSAPGKARFALEDSAEYSHVCMEGEASSNSIEVDVITIDSFVSEHGLTVEAIKIDAEGFDLQVLGGAMQTLQTQRPVVLMETEASPDLFELARQADYSAFAFYRHPTTRKRGFAELQLGTPAPGDTKMLFLVPPHLVGTITEKALAC